MSEALKDALRAALANTSSQAPLDSATLARGHQRRRVEAALMALYAAREVCCCKLIKGGKETVLWWLAGNTCPLPRYGTGVLARVGKGRVL